MKKEWYIKKKGGDELEGNFIQTKRKEDRGIHALYGGLLSIVLTMSMVIVMAGIYGRIAWDSMILGVTFVSVMYVMVRKHIDEKEEKTEIKMIEYIIKKSVDVVTCIEGREIQVNCNSEHVVTDSENYEVKIGVNESNKVYHIHIGVDDGEIKEVYAYEGYKVEIGMGSR